MSHLIINSRQRAGENNVAMGPRLELIGGGGGGRKTDKFAGRHI